MNVSTFDIYNASAGSGKTFTLVKAYLKLVLDAPYNTTYKYILALTFTNKAVGEMKNRIIETLKAFSADDALTAPHSMFYMISEELAMPPKQLQKKSKAILTNIVHNYAAFDISTLDKFSQKLIRTFAYDLRLPLNFDVELDTDTLLSKAVDNLISRAGENKMLTKTLVDFAIEKADDDKSWDIAYDFRDISKLLTNENHITYIETLKNKDLKDFQVLKQLLRNKIKTCDTKIKGLAKGLLNTIQSNGLEFADFSRSYLPKFFTKIASGHLNVAFNLKWQEDLLEGRPLYPKKVSPENRAIIDGMQIDIVASFNAIKNDFGHLKFLKNFYKNITPLSVIHEISKEVNLLKSEQNMLLISEFNAIISAHIKAQPAPFIYERIGERFKHYFIDEFQDTSVMQWENLIPLINNALASGNASSLIVGDAKQAIYRWRGGKAEQFIDLYKQHSKPFQVDAQPIQLDSNYRSFENIVNFNNTFFKHLSTFAFSNEDYKALYSESAQKPHMEKKGYVDISFLELDSEDDINTCYAQHTFDTITSCIDLGYKKSDICVLVRKKKEGIAIAHFLSKHNIDIVSSETLLIANAPEVQFIINLLTFILDNKDSLAKVEVLSYLSQHHITLEDEHEFYKQFIPLSRQAFFKQLETYGYFFNANECIQLPIYEAIELIISDFKLCTTSNAYIQFFLDIVLDFTQKHHANLASFLAYYEDKKAQLTIVSPEGKDAIKIMTIHKSKGLEFPVVIFPFADLDLYREEKPHIWYPIDKTKFNDFEVSYLSYNSDLELIGTQGQKVYHKRRGELELDNINLLYVALTRPVEQLYIISRKRQDKKGTESLKYYSGLFINYLKSEGLWTENQLHYTMGKPKKESSHTTSKTTIEQNDFISIPKKQHHINIIANSGYIWDTSQEDAIEKGNLIHLILSKIYAKEDLEDSFNSVLNSGIISKEQYDCLYPEIENVINHPQLASYFKENLTVYNERDIIPVHGKVIRPDRLVFLTPNNTVLIDYKTGTPHKKHIEQLDTYQHIIEDMRLKVTQKILVYINDSIDVKEF
ncbi:MAG: UvrD-helicase domain-containing protein [Flavobacteriaceae bacterium]|nr:UvrD-helicase domain-containing protein [Flavobacteriaceae bacterium]